MLNKQSIVKGTMMNRKKLGGGLNSVDDYILEADDSTFEKIIDSDLPVLVDFWAPWCGPSYAVSPTVEELACEYEGRVRFVKVRFDEARRTASALDIVRIPTIILFDHGRPIERQIGIQAKADLNEMIEGALRESD